VLFAILRVRVLGVVLLVLAVVACLAARADAYVYWGDATNGTVGRADLDGTDVHRDLIVRTHRPPLLGVAADGKHVYWTSLFGFSIGRANLDGTSVDQTFIATAHPPTGVGVDGNHVYWGTAGGRIGRADLDGTHVDNHFINGVPFAHQLAFDGRHIYWANRDENEIGRANLDGTDVQRRFITTDAPDGVAVEGQHIYWSRSPARARNTIGRANLDGTHVDPRFINEGGVRIFGIAVDSRHIYWTTSLLGIVSAISRADLDGTHVDPDFITDAGSYVQGLAVTFPPPVASISSPAGGGLYQVGQHVVTHFSCLASVGGPALRSCMDSNGSSAPSGHLATGTPGAHHYTAIATDQYGQTGTASIAYTVAAAPSVQITTPAAGGSYVHGQVVSTSFVCHDGIGGPGIKSCLDEKGSTSPGVLDTSTLGAHTYTVTATSQDGQITTKSAHYDVKPPGPPSVQVTTPASGSVWEQGAVVSTGFGCTDGVGGPGIKSCLDEQGSTSPGRLDTSTLGSHIYTVTATSQDGQTTSTPVTYSVQATPPPAPPTAAIAVTPAAAGLRYQLSAAGSSAPAGHQIVGYSWQVAGHAAGTGQTITTTFAQADQPVPVMLTVTDDQGQTASTTTTLTPHAKTVHVRLVVRFVRNRAALTAAARRILNPARGSIRYADTITINGYCAARETSRHPLLVKLSRQRAQTVRTYLFSGDKRPRRNLTLIANGATHFVAPNNTASGRAKNRRVVLVFTYPKLIS
jgi:outer membrane protein OmpA-like peptidoglycan-associated protein